MTLFDSFYPLLIRLLSQVFTLLHIQNILQLLGRQQVHLF